MCIRITDYSFILFIFIILSSSWTKYQYYSIYIIYEVTCSFCLSCCYEHWYFRANFELKFLLKFTLKCFKFHHFLHVHFLCFKNTERAIMSHYKLTSFLVVARKCQHWYFETIFKLKCYHLISNVSYPLTYSDTWLKI